MSENPPFPPFQPSPPAQPALPATPEKQKRQARKKKTVPTITAITLKDDGSPPVVKIEERLPQKRKKMGDKPVLKFDLQTILSAAAELNQDDLAVFEKIVGVLQDAGKPGRERLLAAMGKIFA